MSDRRPHVVFIVGEVAAHAREVADVLALAPPEVHGPCWFIGAALDEGGRAAVDDITAQVLRDETIRSLMYVVVAEVPGAVRLSDQVVDLINARRPFAILGWAPSECYLAPAWQGVDCCVGPVIPRTAGEIERLWDVLISLDIYYGRLRFEHEQLRLAVVTGVANASDPGPITKDVFEDIDAGAMVKAHAVVGLDTSPLQIRTLLDSVKLGDDDIVDDEGICPAPGTLGLKVITALARVQEGDLTEFDRALTWLISMRRLAPCVVVAILDDASLPSFEYDMISRVREGGITLCYGPPNMIRFLLGNVMRQVLTEEAHRVDPPVPLNEGRQP
jgi:hypothetical protein